MLQYLQMLQYARIYYMECYSSNLELDSASLIFLMNDSLFVFGFADGNNGGNAFHDKITPGRFIRSRYGSQYNSIVFVWNCLFYVKGIGKASFSPFLFFFLHQFFFPTLISKCQLIIDSTILPFNFQLHFSVSFAKKNYKILTKAPISCVSDVR